MEFSIIGVDTNITIDVVRRSHPETKNYWDINWITSRIQIKIPGYSVDFEAYLRTDEILRFLNGLKSMNKDLKGNAILVNLDSFIEMECKMSHFGKLLWSFETCYPNGDGAVLTSEFESDQSYLPKLIKELEMILNAFPVIGKP
ncbi:WapI family immunity protein [Bacillus suaedaesalsae]|uniref:Uncharacterized protein n=1 Tax=Bacillus suaedaesalsae TaxID=2810349 RepID=A0ABS2DJV2_9BACI|nr:hypothetical protein [Bacillus suaedaesalsae]MBM6618774.1 hypothetical protein [Bacillus suaedaesalsae]